LEHGGQGADAPSAQTIPDGRRQADHRDVDKPGDDRRQCTVHAGSHDDYIYFSGCELL
jgi:hypothetical protein